MRKIYWVGERMRKLIRVLVSVGAGVLILVLVVWGGPFVFGGHLTSVSSELNFVSLIATLLGGIMAAAGLSVGLVSVFSQTTLDRRIEDKFRQLVEADETERRVKTNRMFQGFALQLQSISSLDLHQAERVTEQALDLYPDLAGSRRQLALRLFDATERSFLSKYVTSKVPSSRVGVRFAAVAATGSYAHEAEKWLERARVHGEDGDKHLTFCLAKLYGMRGRYDLMLEALDQCIDDIDKLEADLFRIIVACAYSCDSEPRIKELSKRIHSSLPMSSEDFFKVVNHKEQPQDVSIFLCRRKTRSVSLYKLPDIFLLRIHDNGNEGYRVHFIGDSSHDIKRAPVEPTDQWYTEEDAWSIVTNEGWVLCPINSFIFGLINGK